MKEPKGRLGRLVRRARQNHSLTSFSLAEKVGWMAADAVSKVERAMLPLNTKRGRKRARLLAKQLGINYTKLEKMIERRVLRPPSASTKTLGGFLAMVRVRLRITQAELADVIGVSVYKIGEVERGKVRPTSWQLHDIKRALKIRRLPRDLD